MILVEKGSSPLIICLPHSGVDIPPAVEARLSATGRIQADISWRLDKVLDVAAELDATIIKSSVSRYVIDVDRDAAEEHAGEYERGPHERLCPTATLDLKNIYKPDEEPGPVEIEQRRMLFYDPFHRALGQEISRLRKLHDQVILVDCQSVRSRIRGYLETEAAVFNIATDHGRSCSQDLKSLFVGSFSGLSGYSVAVDDFFKGGHIIRSYGQPDRGVQALSLVLAQRVYLRHESPPFEPDKARIARLRSALIGGLSRTIDWAAGHGASRSREAVQDLDVVTQGEDPLHDVFEDLVEDDTPARADLVAE